jgi:hypothetical protein
MKLLTKNLFLLGACAVAFASRAEAKVGVADHVPAATLLLPYFEVDFNPGGTRTTLFSVNNASASAVLGRVTLWTDLGVPTGAFSIYLTGYDVVTINLRDLLNGIVPPTASDGQDPGDTNDPNDGISNQGALSQDINFASCNGVLPPGPVPPALVAEIRAAHMGQPAPIVFGGNCAGQNIGDGVARGYITVDTVNSCTFQTPKDPGYFTSVATLQNLLWGDYFYLDPTENFAQGDTLVHIEASSTDPQTGPAGQYTFYGRYVNWDASDHREPLGAVFAARFVNGGAFTGGSSIVSWRDTKADMTSFPCGTPPAPLDVEDMFIFDESENAEEATLTSGLAFPGAAGKVRVDSAELSVTPNFGWIYLNLNHTVFGGSNPPEDPQAAQSWITYLMDASGRFSVGQSAVVLQHASATAHVCLDGSC